MLLFVLKLVNLKMQYNKSRENIMTVATAETIIGAIFLTRSGSTSALPVFSFAVGSVGRMLKEKMETRIVVKRLIPVEKFG